MSHLHSGPSTSPPSTSSLPVLERKIRVAGPVVACVLFLSCPRECPSLWGGWRKRGGSTPQSFSLLLCTTGRKWTEAAGSAQVSLWALKPWLYEKSLPSVSA